MNPIIGIICEYNPPHKGHAHQLSVLRKMYPDAVIVSVMSGSFVQRGTPAIMDKYARARAAAALGADVVLELPYPWSCAPAELFACGGVSILGRLGISHLCFGTEGEGVLDRLIAVARHLDSTEAAVMTASMMNSPENAALGYPAVRDRVLTMLGGDAEAALLRTPNNMLGAEYLRAIAHFGYDITPIAVPRIGDAHDAADLPSASTSDSGRIVSASAIRRYLHDHHDTEAITLLPPASAAVLQEEAARRRLCRDNDTAAAALLLHHYRVTSAETLSFCAGLSGGLAGRFKHAAREARTLDEFLSMSMTKKYTHAAVRRAMWHGFFGTSTADMQSLPPYTLLLAANPRGGAFLRSVRKSPAPFLVITRPAAYLNQPEPVRRAFETALRADVLFGMLLPAPMSEADWLRRTPCFLSSD